MGRQGETPRSRRILGSPLIAVTILGLAACGDDDGGEGGAAATTVVPGTDEDTQENATFCQELVEFGTQVAAATSSLTSPAGAAEWAEEVSTQAKELAGAAPQQVKSTADNLASSATDLARQIADGKMDAAAQINTKIQEAVAEMTTFAQQNCPGGVSVPTTAAAGSGG